MTGSTEHDRIRSNLESVAKEIEYVEEIEDRDDVFFVYIDGGEEAAKHTIRAIEETGRIDDGYKVETYTDPDTDETHVRVVSPTLKTAEDHVTETINHYLEKYDG